ncbi:MAG TPA: hypothetical protein DEO84_05285 [candidate division Zixibacteria bacterium]|nr:hypothetical protein [candidate division Zixibacteria bacterium]
MAKANIFIGVICLCLVSALPCAAQTRSWSVGISQTGINVRGNAVVVGQVDITVADPGKVVVQFDGICIASVGDRIVLAASNTQSWGANDGSVSVEAADADVCRGNFSHSRMYSVTPGTYSFYAVAQNYVETDGTGIVSIYGSLTVKYYPTAEQPIIQFQGISQTAINVRGADVVVGQQTIQNSVAGYVLVRFDGTCISDVGDLIVLAASNSPTWGANDGNVTIEAVNSDINRCCFSHSRLYPVSAGSHTYYAVARNYVEMDGSGIVSIYGSLTIEFIPTIVNHVFVTQAGISQTNINVRGNEVTLGQIDLNLPVAGAVIVHFDGLCVESVGDLIVLAASNNATWGPNDGNVTVEAVNTDVNEQSFSHTRSYSASAGAHSYYAIAQNYVELQGDGIISVYGSLTVQYFPSGGLGIEQPSDIIPAGFTLSQNYPNPFNPTTSLEFNLPEAGHVNLDVYDILGCKVSSLINGYQQAGYHRIGWNAASQPSGVYFYRLQSGEYQETKRMILAK